MHCERLFQNARRHFKNAGRPFQHPEMPIEKAGRPFRNERWSAITKTMGGLDSKKAYFAIFDYLKKSQDKFRIVRSLATHRIKNLVFIPQISRSFGSSNISSAIAADVVWNSVCVTESRPRDSLQLW